MFSYFEEYFIEKFFGENVFFSSNFGHVTYFREL